MDEKSIFTAVDENRDSGIDYVEMSRAIYNSPKHGPDKFEKFDVDKSGHLDSREFSNLASELGTFPPLTEEELDEALFQIDQSDDNEFSFDELWMWWISDKIDDPHIHL